MGRENAKRATMKDLIARKLQRDADRFKTVEVYVPSMDAKLLFKRPSDAVLLDVLDEIGDGDSLRKQVEGLKKLIYRSCELLQSPELHKELDVVDPFDTVDALFDFTELNVIGERITEAFGLSEAGQDLKNESRATRN